LGNMPELAAPTPYRLPRIQYQAPQTPTYNAPQIVPDLQGAAALKGSAAAMGLVADTLAKLPEIVTAGVASGRKGAQQKQVHELKMQALAGQKTPAELRALQGFSFGEDDSLSYKPQDPVLAQLAYDAKSAEIKYKNAAAERAGRGNQPKPTLYDRVTGAVPEGTEPELPEPPVDGGVNGDILPPLPQGALSGMGGPKGTNAVSAPGLPGNAAELAAMGDVANQPQPALAGDPALDAMPPVAPVGQGALANFGAGPTTGPITDVPGGTPAQVSVPAVEPAVAANAPVKNGVVKPAGPGEAAEYYKDGKLTHMLLPGANTWTEVDAPKPEGATFPSEEEAKAAGYDTAGAQVNKDGSITVKKIPIARDQQLPPALAKEARDLGIAAYGKTPTEVETEIIQKRNAEKLLSPAQSAALNQLYTKMNSDVAYKDIQNVKQGYLGLLTAKDENSSAGDIALINSFQRIIDPGVSVREGDVTLLSNAQGILQKIENLPDVLSGKARLHPDMKASMVKTAHNLYKKRVENFYDSSGKKFLGVARANNIPEEMVSMDFGIPIEGLTVPGAPKPSTAVATNGQPGAGGYVPGKRYQGKTYLGGDPTDTVNWQ
jgi:hypothetical protein